MPVVEYLEDDQHESSGRLIPKGSQHVVTRERAKELEDADKVIIVGTDTGRSVQDRTRGVNNMLEGEKSQRVAKKRDGQTGDGKRETSVGMKAKEAVAHIEQTELKELSGFVPDEEDRTTVLDAWEQKQDEGN